MRHEPTVHPEPSLLACLVEDHMTNRSITGADRAAIGRAQRNIALATGLSLLLMAILASFAQFGVLKTLIVPADAAATTNNMRRHRGSTRPRSLPS
jgi:hypothetical protein